MIDDDWTEGAAAVGPENGVCPEYVEVAEPRIDNGHVIYCDRGEEPGHAIDSVHAGRHPNGTRAAWSYGDDDGAEIRAIETLGDADLDLDGESPVAFLARMERTPCDSPTRCTVHGVLHEPPVYTDLGAIERLGKYERQRAGAL